MVGQDLREDCLQRLSVEDVAKKLGIEIKSREGDWLVACCPLHDDTRPSFRIAAVATSSADRDHEKGFFLCHARCGSGSIFDLVQKLGRAGSFKEALAYLSGAAPDGAANGHRQQNGSAAPAPRPRVAKALASVVTPQDVEQAARTLAAHHEALRYLTDERGLSPKAIIDLRLGFVTKPFPAIVIPKPVREPQHFKVLPFPRPGGDSDALRFWHTKGANTKLLYPTNDFGPAKVTEGLMASRVLVVESELDAALCVDLGIKCVAVGGTSHFNAAMLAPLFERSYLPILAPDHDDSGQAALAKCVADLESKGLAFGVVILAPPEGCKDIGDIYKLSGREVTKRWIIDAVENAAFREAKPAEAGGKLSNNLENLNAALGIYSDTRSKLWMNSLGRIKMIGSRRLTDTDVSDIQSELFMLYKAKWPIEEMHARIGSLCFRNLVNPVREHLESLKWDGKSRIDDILGTVVALGPDENQPLKSLYLRKWFIGAVARAFEPGAKMDTMLVFYSEKQGIGKSKFAQVIGGGWYIAESIRPDDKDCKITLHKHWIVEVDELDATTRKRDLADLRAFLSRQEDSIRNPYGRIDEVYKRSFVFLGTTNDKGVVKEEDGRRYWPIEVTAFDIDMLVTIRDQVWAEAVALYKRGERWWLEDGDEEKRRADSLTRFCEDDSATESILEWMENPLWPLTGVTIDAVMTHLKDVGIIVNQKEAPRILRKCGLENMITWLPITDSSEPRKKARRWRKSGKVS